MSEDPDFLIDTGNSTKGYPEENIVYETAVVINEAQEGKRNDTSGARKLFIPNRRYHDMNDFSHIKPGKFSKALLEAVSRDRHEIPLFVYKMRSAGYPPGWLEEARVNNDISFDEEIPSVTNAYDKKLLIEWPGFNTSWKYQTERCEQLRCRPISTKDYIDSYYEHLERKEKRRTKKDLDKHRQELLKEIEKVQSSLGSKPEEPIIIADDSTSKGKEVVHVESSVDETVPESPKEKNSEKKEESDIRIDGSAEPSKEDRKMQILGLVSDTTGLLPAENEMASIFKDKIESTLPETITSENNVSKLPKLENFSQNILPMQPFEPHETPKNMYQNITDLLRKRKRSLNSSK